MKSKTFVLKESVLQLSKTAQKKIEAKQKEKIQAKLNSKINSRKKRKEYTPPNYDEIYYQGVEWLDSLSGCPEF